LPCSAGRQTSRVVSTRSKNGHKSKQNADQLKNTGDGLGMSSLLIKRCSCSCGNWQHYLCRSWACQLALQMFMLLEPMLYQAIGQT
jgi:hypothetical protein